jgi:hypothetical protein
MTIEFIATIDHRHAAATRRPANVVLDHGCIHDFAEAAARGVA